ncbi:MAG: glycosyltransferase family 87 protein [Alphaproteobacteria bacterium]
MRVGIAILALLAAAKLADEFYRLVWGLPENLGAVDLVRRWNETRAWFAGEPVYALDDAIYPPATYPVLWPILGWVSFEGARRLWALVYVGFLWWISSITVRESGVRSRAGRIAAALVPLAFNATGATIGNGQLLLLVLPPLLTACLLAARGGAGGREDLRTDLAIAALFCVAMAKPSASAPFAWIILFCPGRLRPAVLSGAGYVVLTLFGLAFQPLDQGEIGGSDPVASVRRIIGASYGSLQSWLVHQGLEASPLMVVLPALALLGVGAWVWKRRRTDPWNLLGVVSVVARTGWYHRVYDDLLVLPVVIALLRIGTRRAHGEEDLRRAPAILAALACIAAALVPARLHVPFFPGIGWFVNTATIAAWLAAAFLLDREAKRTS